VIRDLDLNQIFNDFHLL